MTWGELKKFAEEHGVPDDATLCEEYDGHVVRTVHVTRDGSVPPRHRAPLMWEGNEFPALLLE